MSHDLENSLTAFPKNEVKRLKRRVARHCRVNISIMLQNPLASACLHSDRYSLKQMFYTKR
eukprot:scaffold20148_cov59-Attheya_sp.AAC.5